MIPAEYAARLADAVNVAAAVFDVFNDANDDDSDGGDGDGDRAFGTFTQEGSYQELSSSTTPCFAVRRTLYTACMLLTSFGFVVFFSMNLQKSSPSSPRLKRLLA